MNGPITRERSDFFLALEKRDIDEFNVVNAVTLDASNDPVPFHQTVSAPQRLWIASGRGDWQVTSKNIASVSFSANVNNLGNQGVGALVLPQAGYGSVVSEYDLRLLNTQTLSPNLLNETRIGYTWKRTEQTPNSTTPSLQIAGYFTGGGATSGTLNNRERDLEIDDDVMVTRGKHSWKMGVQSLGIFIHDNSPDTFNGAYVFGGGSAPVLDSNNNPTAQITTISGIEQYRRALLNLAGGTPTTYQINTGTSLVPLTQWRLALYAQDSMKLTSRFTLSAGLRYQFQTTPNSFANFSPRAGVAWALDSKSTWVIHLRAGLFNTSVDPRYATQVYQLNGVRQHETTVYSPNFTTPLTATTGSVSISTLWRFPPTFGALPSVATQAGVEHEFPHHWHVEADYNYGANWDQIRQRNINAPMVQSSIGLAPDPLVALQAPRPITANENIFQYEKAAHLRGQMLVFALRQNSYKRFSFSANYLRMIGIRSDGGSAAANPQSSYSKNGESSRVDWQMPNVFSFMSNVRLPYKVELSTQINARSGRPYNVTTGTDANGDGSFNDRPSYASAVGSGVYSTPFGLMTANTVNGNVPRNLGTMPGLVHLDANLSRTLTLNPKDKEHPRTLTFNARSANLLNHTNVTTVNTVLSSSALGQPIAAEAARRMELGLRFAF